MANVCDYDYELGRSAFNYFLTDATYSFCKDNVDLYFLDVFDHLFESFSYENCFKQLTIESNGSTTSLTGQRNCVPFSRALFMFIGSVRRQEKDEGILKLFMMLSKFVTVDGQNLKPKPAIHSSGREFPQGGLTDVIMGGEPNHMGDLLGIQSFETQRPEAVEQPMSTPPSISFQPSRAELTVPSTSAGHLPMLSPSKISDGANGTGDMALYSMALKEIGDEDGIYGDYVEEKVNFEPPLWKCTVKFRKVQGVGESSKKRTAKHIASRSAYLQLGYPVLG